METSGTPLDPREASPARTRAAEAAMEPPRATLGSLCVALASAKACDRCWVRFLGSREASAYADASAFVRARLSALGADRDELARWVAGEVGGEGAEGGAIVAPRVCPLCLGALQLETRFCATKLDESLGKAAGGTEAETGRGAEAAAEGAEKAAGGTEAANGASSAASPSSPVLRRFSTLLPMCYDPSLPPPSALGPSLPFDAASDRRERVAGSFPALAEAAEALRAHFRGPLEWALDAQVPAAVLLRARALRAHASAVQGWVAGRAQQGGGESVPASAVEEGGGESSPFLLPSLFRSRVFELPPPPPVELKEALKLAAGPLLARVLGPPSAAPAEAPFRVRLDALAPENAREAGWMAPLLHQGGGDASGRRRGRGRGRGRGGRGRGGRGRGDGETEGASASSPLPAETSAGPYLAYPPEPEGPARGATREEEGDATLSAREGAPPSPATHSPPTHGGGAPSSPAAFPPLTLSSAQAWRLPVASPKAATVLELLSDAQLASRLAGRGEKRRGGERDGKRWSGRGRDKRPKTDDRGAREGGGEAEGGDEEASNESGPSAPLLSPFLPPASASACARAFPLPPAALRASLFPCHVALSGTRSSYFVGGRYLKLRRHVPQTRWIVEGGRKGVGSVEEGVLDVLGPALRAAGHAFVSSGREDADVRMLGGGRPFALEIKNAGEPPPGPLALAALEAALAAREDATGLAYLGLRVLSPAQLEALKESAASKRKSYAALCWIPGRLTRRMAAGAQAAAPLCVRQATPIRVLHRRANLVRPRTAHAIRIELVRGPDGETEWPDSDRDEREEKEQEGENRGEREEKEGENRGEREEKEGENRGEREGEGEKEKKEAAPDASLAPSVVPSAAPSLAPPRGTWFTLHLETDAGFYVKEFVHSDFGRSTPSLGQLLGIGPNARIHSLDVTDVHVDPTVDG